MIGFRSFVYSLLLVFLVSLPTLAAQSTKDVTASEQMKSQAKTTVLGKDAKLPPQDPEYVLGHGDILDVQIYGEGSMAVAAPAPAPGELTSDTPDGGPSGVQVRIDGRASLKHVGEVDVVGMTLTQMADYLKILYAAVYDDPIVTVVLLKSNSKQYTVMGKIATPGNFNIDLPINLVQAIARSGGFTEWANSEITVVRENGSKGTPLFDGNTLHFDYDDFLAGRNLERNILIKAGDIIIVH